MFKLSYVFVVSFFLFGRAVFSGNVDSVPLLEHRLKDRKICFPIKVGNTSCIVILDTGFSEMFTLKHQTLSKILSKRSMGERKTKDLYGYLYTKPFYLIPKINLTSNLVLNNSLAQEESSLFGFRSIVATEGFLNAWKERMGKFFSKEGRIGLKALEPIIFAFDVSEKKCWFAEELGSFFDKRGESVTEYVSLPIKRSQWGLELTLETELGKKTFLLDTGATHSGLQGIKEACVAQAKSKEIDFGEIRLSKLPSTFVLGEIDGILGYDFFEKGTFVLDLSQRKVLFRKNH